VIECKPSIRMTKDFCHACNNEAFWPCWLNSQKGLVIIMKSKRTVISLFLAVLILSLSCGFAAFGDAASGVQNESASMSFAAGNGSSSDPYQISTSAELFYLAKGVNEGKLNGEYFVLTSDIDLGGAEWMPIGAGAPLSYLADDTPVCAYFTGHFDGGGHSVTGLSVKRTKSLEYGNYIGLFGVLDSGSIKNLHVSGEIDVMLKMPVVGGLCAENRRGNISGCSADVSISVLALDYESQTGGQVGGLVGVSGKAGGSTESRAAITNCFSEGDITVSGVSLSTGGFIGVCYSGVQYNIRGTSTVAVYSDISDCYSTGNIYADYAAGTGGFAGSIVHSKLGENAGGANSVSRCYSTGAVRASFQHLSNAAGGLAGYAVGGTGETIISGCYYNETENSELGGIGYVDPDSVPGAYRGDIPEGRPLGHTDVSPYTRPYEVNMTADISHLYYLPASYGDGGNMTIYTGEAIMRRIEYWFLNEFTDSATEYNIDTLSMPDVIKNLTIKIMPGSIEDIARPIAVQMAQGSVKLWPQTLEGLDIPSPDEYIDVNIFFEDGAVDFSITQSGSELSFNDSKYPLELCLHFDATPNHNTLKAVMARSGEELTVLPRSWSSFDNMGTDAEHGVVYGRAYSPGAYSIHFPQEESFSDTRGAWMERPVLYMAERGVIKGIGDGLFAPGSSVTRAQFVTMLMRMLDLDIPALTENTEQFSDVAQGEYYYDAVLAARSLGLILGDEDGDFRPDGTVTRQEVFTMLWRAMGAVNMQPKETGGSLDSFTDSSEIASYAVDAAKNLDGLGIIGGFEDGSLRPQEKLTRAQAAQVLYNFMIWEVRLTCPWVE